VKREPVDLDHEAVLRPVRVDLVGSDVDVGPRGREPGAGDEPEHAALGL
jgi:hypothetical protein